MEFLALQLPFNYHLLLYNYYILFKIREKITFLMCDNQNMQGMKVQQKKTKMESEQSWRVKGYWNEVEQLKYVIFIDFYRTQLNSVLKRKNTKIYKIMASFIQTRNSAQCRCHHTKLLRTFNRINKIIKNFQTQFGFQKYLEVQKILISTHPTLFTKNSKQFKQTKRYLPIRSKTRFKNVGTQTQESSPNKYQIEQISTCQLLQQDCYLLFYPSSLFLLIIE